MARMDVDLEQIKELVKLVEKHRLDELTVEEKGFSVTIKGSEAVLQTVQVPLSASPVHDIIPDNIVAENMLDSLTDEYEEPQDEGEYHQISAMMVGVFYRSPSPEEPHYIEVGDHIEIGQTIGLIEAMKVFSEIPSEIAGEVVEIPAINGKLVQQGDPLVIVKLKE